MAYYGMSDGSRLRLWSEIIFAAKQVADAAGGKPILIVWNRDSANMKGAKDDAKTDRAH